MLHGSTIRQKWAEGLPFITCTLQSDIDTDKQIYKEMWRKWHRHLKASDNVTQLIFS